MIVASCMGCHEDGFWHSRRLIHIHYFPSAYFFHRFLLSKYLLIISYGVSRWVPLNFHWENAVTARISSCHERPWGRYLWLCVECIMGPPSYHTTSICPCLKIWKIFLPLFYLESGGGLLSSAVSTRHFLLPLLGVQQESIFTRGPSLTLQPWLSAASVLASLSCHLFRQIWKCSECFVAPCIFQWPEPKRSRGGLVLLRELK